MDPTTDKLSHLTLADGRTLNIIQPGALAKPSTNWRLTREAFENYRSHLLLCVDNWPKETEFATPEGISVNTFCARFRDARQALLMYGYDPVLQDRHKQIHREAVIGMDPSGKSVWFRARGQAGRQRKITPEVTSVKRGQLVTVSAIGPTPSSDELRAMCTLLKSGRIEGPTQFRGRIDEAVIDQLELEFDVAFVWDEVTDITTLA